MKLSGVISLSAFGVLILADLRGSDSAKVDYTDRNASFAPSATVTPETHAPALDDALQNRRVTPAVLDKKDSAVGGLRAPIDLTETQKKNVIDKNSHPPEARERELSSFDHRESGIQPSAQLEKPPVVTRYQSSLTSASATNMSRFPALDRATTSRINRFVFRKNEPAGAAPVSVTPVAGGFTP
jgi:hypothetical protein